MSYHFSHIYIVILTVLLQCIECHSVYFLAPHSDDLTLLTSYRRDLLMMGAWAIALQSFKGDPLPVCTRKAYLSTDKLTFSPPSPTTLLVTTVYTKTLSTR